MTTTTTWSQVNTSLAAARATVAWNLVAASPAYSDRNDHAMCIHDGKAYISGGLVGATTREDDVYEAALTDLTSWTQKTTTGAFGQISGHAMVSFGGDLYILGGNISSTLNSNVYKSTDNGANWSLVTASPGWSARQGHRAIVVGSTLYVIGGQNASVTNLNDVWSTTNGSSWSQVTQTSAMAARSWFGLTEIDGTVYVVGGVADGAGGNTDTIYSSTDLASWTEQTSTGFVTGAALDIGWRGRAAAISIHGKIYIQLDSDVLNSGEYKEGNWIYSWTPGDGDTLTAFADLGTLGMTDNNAWPSLFGGYSGYAIVAGGAAVTPGRYDDVFYYRAPTTIEAFVEDDSGNFYTINNEGLVSKSTDGGTNWSDVATSIDDQWGQSRTGFAFAWFNGSIRTYGGLKSLVTYADGETFYSNDGITWAHSSAGSTNIDVAGQWGSAVVAGSTIVVMSGRASSSDNGGDEVYSSTDGVSFTEKTTTAEYGERMRSGVFFEGSTIYLFGGTDGSDKRDLWKTLDYGATWTFVREVTEVTAGYFPAAFHMLGAYYIVGGVTGLGVSTDDAYKAERIDRYFTLMSGDNLNGHSPSNGNWGLVAQDGAFYGVVHDATVGKQILIKMGVSAPNVERRKIGDTDPLYKDGVISNGLGSTDQYMFTAPSVTYTKGLIIEVNSNRAYPLSGLNLTSSAVFASDRNKQMKVGNKAFAGDSNGYVNKIFDDLAYGFGFRGINVAFKVMSATSNTVTLQGAPCLPTEKDGMKKLTGRIKETEETFEISSNTAEVITVTANWTTTPTVGQTVLITPIDVFVEFREERYRAPTAISSFIADIHEDDGEGVADVRPHQFTFSYRKSNQDEIDAQGSVVGSRTFTVDDLIRYRGEIPVRRSPSYAFKPRISWTQAFGDQQIVGLRSVRELEDGR